MRSVCPDDEYPAKRRLTPVLTGVAGRQFTAHLNFLEFRGVPPDRSGIATIDDPGGAGMICIIVPSGEEPAFANLVGEERIQPPGGDVAPIRRSIATQEDFGSASSSMSCVSRRRPRPCAMVVPPVLGPE